MSCNQDEDVLIDIEETEPDHVVLVYASFLGKVTDSDGQTLADVTITLGESEVTTGNDGQYTIEGKANLVLMVT